MTSQYLTQTELVRRWSKNLVDEYYPFPEEYKPNPRHKRGAPMRLYDVRRIKRIESDDEFREKWAEVLKRRIARMEKKRAVTDIDL